MKWLKSGKGGISLNNMGMKKCRKGMIRGFMKALLVIRDPFAALWNKMFGGVTDEEVAVLLLKGDAESTLLQLRYVCITFWF